MKRKKYNLFLHLFLSAVLILTSFYQCSLSAMADDEHPDVVQSGITYVYDAVDGCYHCCIGEENAETLSGADIAVPGGCILHVVDADAALNSMTIEDGGTVEIITGTAEVEKTLSVTESLNLSANSNLVISGLGRLTATNISAEESALLNLESISNKPSVIAELYDPLGQEVISVFADTKFRYTGSVWAEFTESANEISEPDNETTVSGDEFAEPADESLDSDDENIDSANVLLFSTDLTEIPSHEFQIFVDGYTEGIVRASYSIDGENYTVLNDTNSGSWTSGIDSYGIGFGIYDEGWDPDNGGTAIVKVELVNTSKVMLLGGLGDEYFTGTYVIPFNLDAQPQEYSYTFSTPANLDQFPHDIHFALGYSDGGNGEIVNTVNNYIYGYSSNIVGSLAKELYYRFIEVPMYERFGINSSNDLAAKITASGNPYTINVQKADGSTETRSVQNYTIAWGTDDYSGEPVSQTIPVYTLSSDSEYLICTDFNESTGTGTTFYSRIAGTDEVNFSSNGDAACSITLSSLPNLSRVQIGGNGVEKNIMNDDGIYTYSVNTFPMIQNNVQETDWGRYFSSVCRIMSSAKEYVVINGSGESKNYGGLGDNGNRVDDVWTTGSGSQTQNAYVYIGNTTLSLEAISGSGKTVTGIVLADASLADGVTISGATLTFECNYYDSVPVIISFSDGSTKSITINRIGLVIQYKYLEDDRDWDDTTATDDFITYDCKGGSCHFTRDYDSGEQILIYATYYHPTTDHTVGGSNDLYLNLTFANGTSRVVKHDSTHNFTNGYLPADASSVATTSFIIGFAPAKIRDDFGEWVTNITQQIYSEGPFYATVLNAGYNDDDTYGGTQTGSGKGVYWDGVITWYE